MADFRGRLESWLEFAATFRAGGVFGATVGSGARAVMASYAESFGVPIALDESLHGAGGLRWLRRAMVGAVGGEACVDGDAGALVERLRPVARRWCSRRCLKQQSAWKMRCELPINYLN